MRLENAVMRGQEFDKSLHDLQDKFSSLEFQMKRQSMISVEFSKVSLQQQEQKIILKELKNLKVSFEHLINAADKMINSLEAGEEKDFTELKVNEVKKEWENLSNRVYQRLDIIDKVEPISRIHHKAKKQVEEWLLVTESVLKDLEQVPTTREELFKFKKSVNKLSIDTENHKIDHSTLNESLEKLSAVGNDYPKEVVDLQEVSEDTNKLNKKWLKLETDIATFKLRVDTLSVIIVKYFNGYNAVDKAIDDLASSLKYQTSYGIDKDLAQREFEKIKSNVDLCSKVKEDLEAVGCFSIELEELINEYEGDNLPVKESTKKLNCKLKEVQNLLLMRKDDVEKKNKVLSQFFETLKVVNDWYLSTIQKLAAVGPVKLTSEQVKEQLEVVNVCFCFLDCIG